MQRVEPDRGADSLDKVLDGVPRAVAEGNKRSRELLGYSRAAAVDCQHHIIQSCILVAASYAAIAQADKTLHGAAGLLFDVEHPLSPPGKPSDTPFDRQGLGSVQK